MTVVRGSGGRWTAEVDGAPAAELRAVTMPDGRCALRLPVGSPALPALLAAALAELGTVYAMVDADDADTLAALTSAGFERIRAEGVYVVPVTAPPRVTPGVQLVSAAEADLDRLRELDEVLREDIPGSAGWRWTAEAFRHETLGDPAFDPRTYLVAVRDGEYVGLVRVWMNRSGPRLGCLAVLPAHRRTRVTSALLTTVLAELAARGHTGLVTEVSDDNAASLALIRRAGARRTATVLELARHAG